MLGRIAAILGEDIPVDEFTAILANRRKKAKSFGLAELLARELRTRRNGDAAAKRDRQAANDAAQIQTLESMLTDPNTPSEDHAELQSMLDELRHKKKFETGKSHEGAFEST